MMRYTCMLRAVNVSGQRKVSMAALRELCVSLGHADVETYLQSGNVIFSSKKSQAKLGPSLSAAIAERFGYADVDVLVWTAAELAALIRANPFAVRHCDVSKLHVTFLAKDVGAAPLKGIGADAYLPDEFASAPRAIYVHCPNGYGRTKLNNAFFERKLGTRATTRNWQSVNNLCQLAGK